MSKVFIEESTLTAIGNAIRSKTGGTDLIAPLNMPTEINGISTGGGTLPSEALNITGSCINRFSYNGWNWFINNYGSQVTTNNITDCTKLFYFNNEITTIPFSINCDSAQTYIPCTSMFDGCNQLTALPEITITPFTFDNIFHSCSYLREIPDSYSETFDFTYLNSYFGAICWYVFAECFSLRKIPSGFLKKIYCLTTNKNRHIYYHGFQNCYCLDEIVGLPIGTAVISGNAFTETFTRCHRVKNIIFDTNEDGTAKTAQWTNQVIDLTEGVGYCYSATDMTNYNSGITADKEVDSVTTYDALKEDPDWFASALTYSRYDKASAIATINSLPDTSAYLATTGGTNTIKFQGGAGGGTDNGAISAMTEEEIAVATAKGWSVAYS